MTQMPRRAYKYEYEPANADEIRLTNGFMPCLFFFKCRGGHAGLCGGLILHGQEAYYGIHTWPIGGYT